MNSNTPNPSPENSPANTAQAPSESGCGILQQTVHGASRSVASSPALHPPAHSFRPAAFDDLGFVYPPEMPAEPDFDFDDNNESARERELLMEDLASDNDDFARSDEDGWYYSDEDSGMDAVPDSSDWED
jgi:hypothetical protein